VVPYPDVAPFADNRFDCCDLLQRNVIHRRTLKASGISSWFSCQPTYFTSVSRRLAPHVREMSRKQPKHSGGSDQNKAVARWENEGGAPKGAPQEDRNELAPLTNEEEHILRCLGAAVLMRWNDLPTKIQRELFEHASSMGELKHTAELKGQVARFLHQHKDDGRESA
jgi:hypothetical protein